MEKKGMEERTEKKLPKLPIGIQTFKIIRTEGYLYVDKTKYLVDLVDNGRIYFLSRPRRFGKSLTISTFDALFSGEKELFQGLYAENFMNRPDYKTYPVVRLDMSNLTTHMGPDAFRVSILERIQENARRLDVSVESPTPGDAFYRLLINAAEKYKTPVVLLIDEYDSPILRHLFDLPRITEIRGILKDFYMRVKAADEVLRFVFMTGISKFSKMGVFSALNSLDDISADTAFAAMLGYTEEELALDFAGFLDAISSQRNESKRELLTQIKNYYDGFSFDGETRLYNPFSALNFFRKKAFLNFWFESGTPSFLVDYIKRHDVEVEAFRGYEVSRSFTSITEIEQASPENFLFQSGYLTVRACKGDNFILDYPNEEVLSSVARLFLYGKLDVKGFDAEANNLSRALTDGDAAVLARMYDKLLMTIPYDIYEKEEKKYADNKTGERNRVYPLAESFFHALLFSMLWASCARTTAENHSYKGRSDIEAEKNGHRYVIELKVAEGKEAAEKAARAALRQIHEKGYADRYAGEDVTLLGLGVDRQARRVAKAEIEHLGGTVKA
ncbi:MAG: ATP-binding protein [Synergistaceae bacterium]|nr:ATP-binding protein [Synergistaceae bacterium]